MDGVQALIFHVSFGGLAPEMVTATIQQAGQLKQVTLVDNGSDPYDAAGDRVYTGSVEGNPAQYLPVTLNVQVDGAARDVYQGTLRIGLEQTVQLAFEVTRGPDGHLTGVRRASASPGRMSHATEAIPLIASIGWGIFALVLGSTLLNKSEAGRDPR